MFLKRSLRIEQNLPMHCNYMGDFNRTVKPGRYRLLTDVYLKTLQEDGSLVAWDLREPLSMHYMSKISVGDKEIILRSPTFSTGGSPELYSLR